MDPNGAVMFSTKALLSAAPSEASAGHTANRAKMKPPMSVTTEAMCTHRTRIRSMPVASMIRVYGFQALEHLSCEDLNDLFLRVVFVDHADVRDGALAVTVDQVCPRHRLDTILFRH